MLSSFSISHTTPESRADVRRTVFFAILISLFPLILGFFAVSRSSGFPGAFQQVFLHGDLYFYAMSICGSIFVGSVLNNHEANLGMRAWSAAFILFVAGFMALYVADTRAGTDEVPAYHIVLSVLFLAMAVFIHYRVSILADQPPPLPESVNRERADEIIDNVDPDYD